MPVWVTKKSHPFFFAGLTELSLIVPKYELGFLFKFDGIIFQRLSRRNDVLYSEVEDGRRCLDLSHFLYG